MGRKLSPANDEIDPVLLRELLSQGDEPAMQAVGVRPALIYAYERTG